MANVQTVTVKFGVDLDNPDEVAQAVKIIHDIYVSGPKEYRAKYVEGFKGLYSFLGITDETWDQWTEE